MSDRGATYHPANRAASDVCVLGGAEIPSAVTIEGLEAVAKWDVKESPGSDGAVMTYQGYTPAPFSLTFALWTEAQDAAFRILAAKIRPKPGRGQGQPVDVAHVDLDELGIRKCIVKKIRTKREPGGKRTVTIECQQWFRQPKKNVTTTALAAFGNALLGTDNAVPQFSAAANAVSALANFEAVQAKLDPMEIVSGGGFTEDSDPQR